MQEGAQVQGNQKSRRSIGSAVKSFIAISAVSAAIVAGSSVAIGLACSCNRISLVFSSAYIFWSFIYREYVFYGV